MPKYAVLIGRFQPFHNAHYEILKHALSRHDKVIVAIGSARQARSPKNPFTAKEREILIADTLTPEQQARVQFIHVRDYLYNDNLWLTDIQRSVKAIVDQDPGPISIVGRVKDRTSYYVRQFPQWGCDEYTTRHPIDATTVRQHMFEGNWEAVKNLVAPRVYETLYKVWAPTPDAKWLVEEYNHYKGYKEIFQYSGAPDIDPVFFTVDAVVVQSGHVLLVRRRTNPGKGLYALPGGFLKSDETTEAGMLRELQEETSLMVPKSVLRQHIVAQKLFDHPDRSLRGRVISHGFCINLPDGDLIDVKGADDADRAFWLPLADVSNVEDQFFDDHVHIIRYFTSRF